MTELEAKEEPTDDDFILAALNIMFMVDDGSVITRETFDTPYFELVRKVKFNRDNLILSLYTSNLLFLSSLEGLSRCPLNCRQSLPITIFRWLRHQTHPASQLHLLRFVNNLNFWWCILVLP